MGKNRSAVWVRTKSNWVRIKWIGHETTALRLPLWSEWKAVGGLNAVGSILCSHGLSDWWSDWLSYCLFYKTLHVEVNNNSGNRTLLSCAFGLFLSWCIVLYFAWRWLTVSVETWWSTAEVTTSWDEWLLFIFERVIYHRLWPIKTYFTISKKIVEKDF